MASKKVTYSSLAYALHAPQIKGAMLAAKTAAMAVSASNDEDRAIGIEVAAGSNYAHLRVTFDYSEVVIYDTMSGTSQPRHNGALISILIEMIGSPGDKVTLDVENAVPKNIDCTITAGTSSSKTQVLKAKW